MVNSKAQELMNMVNATLKKDVLTTAANPRFTMSYTPTGILPIDILFQGGVPRGRFIELYGDYCVVPETKVLTTMLDWVPASALDVGDEIVGFDEELNQGRGKNSKLRPARVERVRRRNMVCYRILTDRGETTVSANHRMVAKHRSQGTREWRYAEDIRVGDALQWFGAPWEREDSRDAGYAAGFFDGEGWIDGTRICAGQLPGAAWNTVQGVLDRSGVDYTVRTPSKSSGVVSLAIKGGLYDSLKFLGRVRPQRLFNDSEKMWCGRDGVKKGPNVTPGANIARVLEVECVGETEVVAFSTDTKTYISDGFFSHNSTLKSYVGIMAIAEHQRRGMTCAVIDTEHSFDMAWAQSCGVNTDDLIMHWPDTGEEAMDVAQALIAGGINLIVFDSIAAMTPQAEQDKRLHGENIQPARIAMLMSAALRRLTTANTNTSMIFINQLRTNIGVTFGSNEALPGGKAMPYYASYRLSIRKVGKVTRDRKLFDGEKWVNTKEQIGQKFKAELTKSKLSKPFSEEWFTWSLLDGSLDTVSYLIAQGLEHGLIDQKGNTWTCGSKKAVGRQKFIDLVNGDADLKLDLENKVRVKRGLEPVKAATVKTVKTSLARDHGPTVLSPSPSRGKSAPAKAKVLGLKRK